jgi:histidinol-phosphate aminotransferase
MGLNRRQSLITGAAALSACGLAACGLAANSTIARSATRSKPLRLSLNENPFGPSSLAADAVRAQLREIYRYGDGGAALTQAIVAREKVSAGQIVLGEILELLGRYLAGNGPSGGEFIYSEPGYSALVDAVRPAGGTVIGVPIDKNLQNDLSAIAARMGPRTRAIYLVNPHNPTGTVSDAATFIAFVREMSAHATVIVDEAYLEFEPDFAQRTAASLTRDGHNVIVFRTFGKIYSLAGLSIGYAIVPLDLANSLRRAGIGAPDAFDRVALAAATASLRDVGYIAEVRGKVFEERRKWNALFERMRLRHSDSRGNFVFFEIGRPHHQIAEAMLAKGIDIGRAFPPLDNWARISIGLPSENAIARAAVVELLS